MRLELDENSNDSMPFSRNSMDSTSLRNSVDNGAKSSQSIVVNGIRKSTSNVNLDFDTASNQNKDAKMDHRSNKSIVNLF